MVLIEANNISVDHRVKSVSFTLSQGEVLGLIGPNGAGKSTLLNALVNVESKTGQLLLLGEDVESIPPNQRARTLGLLPQSLQSAWSLTVEDVVSLGRIPWNDSDGEAVHQAMERAEVLTFAKRKVDELSGGERARVWLARVLAGQPQVLLADEPIASLDIHYQLSVMNVLKNYAEQDHGVIVAMHDLSLAARYCDRLALMHEGRLVALGGVNEVCNEATLASVYGVEVEVDLQRQPPIVLPR